MDLPQPLGPESGGEFFFRCASHQHAGADGPAAAAHGLASGARSRGVDVTVAPVEVEAGPLPSLDLVVFVGR